MKQVGCCEQCYESGILESVAVVEIASPGTETQLLLCRRCAAVPSAVWRRRYRPVSSAAPTDRREASPSPNSRR